MVHLNQILLKSILGLFLTTGVLIAAEKDDEISTSHPTIPFSPSQSTRGIEFNIEERRACCHKISDNIEARAISLYVSQHPLLDGLHIAGTPGKNQFTAGISASFSPSFPFLKSIAYPRVRGIYI